MIQIRDKQIYSTGDKYIHRIGTDTYFKRSTALPSDIESDFEEVDEIPAYTKNEYDAKVAELVREKYSESEEFALQRKAINATFLPSTLSADNGIVLEEYSTYNSYVEECKARAKDPSLYNSAFRESKI